MTRRPGRRRKVSSAIGWHREGNVRAISPEAVRIHLDEKFRRQVAARLQRPLEQETEPEAVSQSALDVYRWLAGRDGVEKDPARGRLERGRLLRAVVVFRFMLSPEGRETFDIVIADLAEDRREMLQNGLSSRAVTGITVWRLLTEGAGLFWQQALKLLPLRTPEG